MHEAFRLSGENLPNFPVRRVVLEGMEVAGGPTAISVVFGGPEK